MSPIRKYRYTKEVEMLLKYFIPQLKKAQTKEEAEEDIWFLQYLLQFVVEKYYRAK